MIKRFWLLLIVFIVEVSALIYLMHKGITWYESMLIVLVIAFINYLDGVSRGNR